MIRVAAIVVVGAALLVACGDKSSSGSGTCGDGVLDSDEACDDGSLNGTGGGCTATCSFTCSDPVADCGAPPACQSAVCTPDHACIFVADVTQDGTTCGSGEHCDGGSCVSDGECGNGVVEGTEACDFGANNSAGAGCEPDCTMSCTDQASCDDGNLCNGAESCVDFTDTASGNAGKKCASGSAATNGTTCATGICINADCIPASCGDSYTTAPNEECDDANPTPNDGCENNCAFTCLSTDTARNCTPADSCKGQGTCNDTNHTCTPGTPLPNNTACGTGGYCKNTVCTQPVCPDGTKTPNETCDDGNQSNGDGCDTDCTYSCVTPSTDCGTPPACQMYTCSTQHTCQLVPDPSKNTMSCGTNGETCNNGACTGGVCGNAVTETGEQCDFGNGSNGPNTGCETSCSYSCTISPNSCLDANPCNGTELCAANTVNGHPGQKCNAGTPLPNNTNCGTAKICRAAACVTSVCGDGYVDASIGENCEPPNTASCDSRCHPKVCGDGILADNEQCDDGNLNNLDGCSKTCKFEQCQRINDLSLQFVKDAAGGYCTTNALGLAVGNQAQTLISDAINTGVNDGSISIFFNFMGLDDLSGTADPSVTLGLTSATPVLLPSTTFAIGRWTPTNGNADLDWWYTVDTADLDVNRVPTSTISGSIVAKLLSTMPANMTFTVNFVGVGVTMVMFNTRFQVQAQATSTPKSSTGTTPGHLAAEHLDPTITSFEAMGTHDASNIPSGKLCGATTAGSLYNTHVPAAVIPYCGNYTLNNTLLDLYTHGCTYLIFFPIVKATVPDTSRSGSDTYRFQYDTTMNKITTCTKNGGALQAEGTAGFTDCLNNAGFTSYYRFTMDRVIGK